MKLFLIWTFTSSARINVFHYCMFHGEVERAGVVYPSDPSHSIGDDLSDPLLLSVNAYKLPLIFKPAGCLVIREDLKDRLLPLEGLQFCQVSFKKAVNYPYAAGDMSYYRRPEFTKNPIQGDPEALIARLPDDVRLRRSLPHYYELIQPWDSDLATNAVELQTVSFTVAPLGFDEDVEVVLDPQSLVKFPIIRVSEGMLLTEPAFTIMSPGIDLDYFSVSTATMD